MRVYRFMSKSEFKKYRKGETLINKVNHREGTETKAGNKTNSIGFCFFDFDEIPVEEAMHIVSGLVSFDICAVFEVDEKALNKTYGIYATPIKSTGDYASDLINLFFGFHENETRNEYCTTKYSKKNFKLIKYAENIWFQWSNPEEQTNLKWINV